MFVALSDVEILNPKTFRNSVLQRAWDGPASNAPLVAVSVSPLPKVSS
jgi:hypothetical protein